MKKFLLSLLVIFICFFSIESSYAYETPFCPTCGKKAEWIQVHAVNGHGIYCNYCPNPYSPVYPHEWGKYYWRNKSTHEKTCNICGLEQSRAHTFLEVEKKEIDNIAHAELDKHWKICTTCDPKGNNKEVDEEHEDDKGICTKCGQVLWKIISEPDGTDITAKIIAKEKIKATREQKIKIIEVVNEEIYYVQNIAGAYNIGAENDVITIEKNGEYRFETVRGGEVTFEISNISRELKIEKIANPIVSTTGNVIIVVRSSKGEEKYDKKIYIKEGQHEDIDIETVESEGDNQCIVKKVVTSNGIYYFTAKDSVGNLKKIRVEVDNIIKGQATVAISNDVFKGGYAFTEILVNPNIEWEVNAINARAYKLGNISGEKIEGDNIKVIRVSDMQRNKVEPNAAGRYLPGEYYIEVAIGGSIFNEEGTYVIDLEGVEISDVYTLEGKNRIIVGVQEFRKLT